MNPAIIGLIVGALLGKKRSEDINFGNNSRYQNNGGSRDGDNSRGNSRGNGEDGLRGSSRTGSGTGVGLRGDMGLVPFDRGSSDVTESIVSDVTDSLVNVGKSTGASKGYFDYNPNSDPLNPSDWMDALSSYLAGQSGYDLTNAQKGQLAFNHDEALLQRQWETQMSNTAFQRQVADMQLAGINPAMAVGGNGASTPSGASASASGLGVGGDLIGRILDFALGKSQLKMQELLSARSNASAERIAEISAGANVRAAEIAAHASIYGSDKGYQGKHEETEEQRRQFDAFVEERKENLRVQNNLLKEQAKTEEERRNAYAKDALLNETKAKDIEIMRPYVIAYNEAKTDEAKWNASCAMVEAQFRNSLVSNGLVHYTMEHLRVQKNVDEFRSEMLEVAKKRMKVTDDGLHRGIWYLASLMNDLKSLYMINPADVFNLDVGSHSSSTTTFRGDNPVHHPVGGFR